MAILPHVTSTIRVYIMTSHTRSWELLETLENVPFSTEVKLLDIPLPVKTASRARWYKIRVAVEGVGIDLFNIERRFRVTGRAR